MSLLDQHRIDTATHTIRTGLDDLLREARTGLDAADQRHLLQRLYDPAEGGTGLLPLLAEVLTTASGAVREWQPNHEAAIEALDEAAAYVADSAGHRINTARNLLTRPAARDWPTPEQAYANAPSIHEEIGWTVRNLACNGGREFRLRKAALLDRIALGNKVAPAVTDLTGVVDIAEFTEAATQAARQLMDLDNAAVICDSRHYVRQQYALWITNP
ncbi:hypothetical protein ACFT0G_03755 [Streptomyces sp. NPDC057020]|uniref:hypothetical protein n=1 Tax=unclassified Streptomyces TaxID=2593676 RepID=UPI0036399AEB